MFNIGFSELMVLFLVALIVLGPERLPELGKFLAKLSIELRKSIEEIKRELEVDEVGKELTEAKKEIEHLKEEATSVIDVPIKEISQEPLKTLDKKDEQDKPS
ncbi:MULTISPECIES: Sec-independent protein translocase protein TatB [Thermodesulfobacterium]|jgi:sec-independent protein translocase protein TatB|uniref:Twin-arginine translocase subunit TatB n=1 Tax=Thermodesulfobacterium commune TaxID=1741 RepID=A0A101FIL9_9BACT|nr:Sec-independent protein translocase protein TatB [Thermodesulfobacterium sp.]KUJ97648.1 MAG: Twin-arginine translocation protein, TatB subunit [Thermodesulfobacterium sp. 37_54]KUK19529.1 MAG: Twin-arginine translocation protein, TatB subunit [Thermodesulfobacterium commune]KUK37732.1 MAG: Twin-arginine translocation protein, TatB subunit [Thermodesulfobacterium commune]MBZ4681086.1 tatB [Thermodesulfobacterium sp.]MDK2861155.1 sec-independent protein translocase protein TatB [Thermodesulfo